MAVNPMQLMKLRERFSVFQSQHPRFVPFLQYAGGSIREGSVIEMKITDPDGHDMITNIKVTPQDMETIELLKTMR